MGRHQNCSGWLERQLQSVDADLSRPWNEYQCMKWPFADHGKGGQVYLNGKNRYVRRVVFAKFIGPVYRYTCISNLCGDSSCFHPAHLKAERQLKRIDEFRNMILALNDDPAKKWSEYSCLEWEHSRTTAGYGTVCENKTHIYTHRLSYAIAHGIDPDNLHVLHRCDNPPCFRPSHLFLGTDKDNTLDRISKKRSVYHTKHSPDFIREIRSRKSKGESLRSLGKDLNINTGYISEIVNRKVWRDLPD